MKMKYKVLYYSVDKGKLQVHHKLLEDSMEKLISFVPSRSN